jgi:uncharacterized protein YfdQ (DUF2303 family)
MTEAEAIGDFAVRAAGTVQTIESHDSWALLAVPEGYNLRLEDWSSKLAVPQRSTGTVAVHDVESFMAAIGQRADDDIMPIIYADEEASALVAVLDDDHASLPGWRQYRVTLDLRRTAGWAAWVGVSNKHLTQEAFAEFVEERSPDFIEPDAATMLELAQSVEGKTSVNWKQGNRLKDGSRQILWDETVEAKAGTSGQLAVPDRLTIGIKPFYGSPDTKVEVLLRLRIKERKLFLVPLIPRLVEIERAIFSSMVAEIAQRPETWPIVRGPAPAGR